MERRDDIIDLRMNRGKRGSRLLRLRAYHLPSAVDRYGNPLSRRQYSDRS